MFAAGKILIIVKRHSASMSSPILAKVAHAWKGAVYRLVHAPGCSDVNAIDCLSLSVECRRGVTAGSLMTPAEAVTQYTYMHDAAQGFYTVPLAPADSRVMLSKLHFFF